jgi:hypothetical protein
MTVTILVTRCKWSEKTPRREMWLSMEPGWATCACGGVQQLPNGVFPEHGRGQCYLGHCQAWPADAEVVYDK